MSGLFFLTLIAFVSWLASNATKARMELEAEKAIERHNTERDERRRLLAELEEEFYGDDIPERSRKPRHAKTAEAKPKRTVKFVDAEDIPEAEEPKGRHVYDPVAHKVVFVPAE